MRVVPGMMNNVYRRGEIAGYRAEFVIARAAKIVKRNAAGAQRRAQIGLDRQRRRLQHGGKIFAMIAAA